MIRLPRPCGAIQASLELGLSLYLPSYNHTKQLASHMPGAKLRARRRGPGNGGRDSLLRETTDEEPQWIQMGNSRRGPAEMAELLSDCRQAHGDV